MNVVMIIVIGNWFESILSYRYNTYDKPSLYRQYVAPQYIHTIESKQTSLPIL